jgi:hypothetical protein
LESPEHIWKLKIPKKRFNPQKEKNIQNLVTKKGAKMEKQKRTQAQEKNQKNSNTPAHPNTNTQ